MTELIDAFVHPGMYVYHGLMAVVVLYWLVSAIGLADLEILDAILPDFGGPDADVDVDADAEVGVDGGADGLLEKMLGAMHVGIVPMTLLVTFIVVKLWLIALAYHIWVVPKMGDAVPTVILAIVAFGLIFVIAMFATSITARPLRNVFKLVTVHGQQHLVGKVCVVKTTRVTSRSGQAEIIVDDVPMLLSVTCDIENDLAKGSEAAIVSYDKVKNTYEIRGI